MKTHLKTFFTDYARRDVLFAAALFLSGMLGISSCARPELDSEMEVSGHALKAKTETLESQLKEVRKAAMRFHSFEQAEKAGYAEPFPFNPSPFVPNMGFHYINVGLMDGTFEMEKPEILLYVPNAQGKLKLVAVEYAVPVGLSPEPPEGFIGGEDHWEYNPNVAGGAWTLHAWVVLENPDGIFAPHNRNVPASDPSLD
jgi:hypothetical protein